MSQTIRVAMVAVLCGAMAGVPIRNESRLGSLLPVIAQVEDPVRPKSEQGSAIAMHRDWGPHDELVEILHGLEHGIEALRKLGRPDALEMVERVAAEVRRELHGRAEPHRQSEREIALHHLEIMRSAIPALREAERLDAADLLERAIRARELAIQGRRDAEAMRIRAGAPDLSQQIEILSRAAHLWDEFGHEGKAGALRELAQHYTRQLHRERDEAQVREREAHVARERERARGGEDIMRRELEVLRLAHHAAREAERRDAAEILERAIRARIVTLEGMEGDEARIARERNPAPGQLSELLAMSAELWAHFGHAERAEVCAEMSRHFRELAGESRGRDRAAAETEAADRERAAHRAHEENRVREIERALVELSEQLARLKRELAELRESRRPRP